MKTRTELCERFEAKDNPSHTRHLLGMILSAIGIALLIVFGSLLMLLNYADEIDKFFNSKEGALTIVFILGTWSLWRISVIVKSWRS